MVSGRVILMKKFLYYLSISIILTTISYSKNVFSKSLDSDATIDGRWRGITLCKWDIENWGGGEYELGNGKFSSVLDFSIITENGEKKLNRQKRRFVGFLERAKGFEPSTSTLARLRSTNIE